MDVERAIRKAVEVLTPVGVVVWVPADPAQGLAGSVLAGPDQRGVISAMSAGISRGHQRGVPPVEVAPISAPVVK